MCTGWYKPGQVKLKPSILKDCQDAVVTRFGDAARFYLVFHGGSGSQLRDIHEALDYGVVKMNIDTDMQYAFTRVIADHCFKHYDGVLRVDAEVGNKKAYDPRAYMTLAENAMAARVRASNRGAAVRRNDDDPLSRQRGSNARQEIDLERRRRRGSGTHPPGWSRSCATSMAIYRFGRDLASAQELNHVLYDPLLADSGPMFEYEPGSWGPPQADRLVAGVGGWNTPQ